MCTLVFLGRRLAAATSAEKAPPDTLRNVRSFTAERVSISNADCLHQLTVNKVYYPNESIICLHECSSLFLLLLRDV